MIYNKDKSSKVKAKSSKGKEKINLILFVNNVYMWHIKRIEND